VDEATGLGHATAHFRSYLRVMADG